MKFKNIIILLISGIIMFSLIFYITYNIVLKSNDNKPKDPIIDTNTNKENKDNENNNESNDLEENNKEQYTNINIYTATANKIKENIPINYQSYTIKDLNEYKIYTSLKSAMEKNPKTDNMIENTFYGYTQNDILNEAKNIFGDNHDIKFKSKYTLPIYVSNDKKILTILPQGTQDKDEYIELNEIKENDKEYIVNIYLIVLEYSLENDDIYVNTSKSLTTENKEDMIKINPKNNEKIALDDIVEKYKERLPELQYTMIKDDKNENKMYINDIKYIK